jgi:hypothetical protein
VPLKLLETEGQLPQTSGVRHLPIYLVSVGIIAALIIALLFGGGGLFVLTHRHSTEAAAAIEASAAALLPAIPAEPVAAAPAPTPDQSVAAAPAPAPVPDPRDLSAAEIAELVARGDAFLHDDDLASARVFYERAAEAGDHLALMRWLALARLENIETTAAAAAALPVHSKTVPEPTRKPAPAKPHRPSRDRSLAEPGSDPRPSPNFGPGPASIRTAPGAGGHPPSVAHGLTEYDEAGNPKAPLPSPAPPRLLGRPSAPTLP